MVIWKDYGLIGEVTTLRLAHIKGWSRKEEGGWDSPQVKNPRLLRPNSKN